MSTEHAQLVSAVVRTLKFFRSVRVWQSNTGAVQHGNRFVRYGRPGQADITGIIAPRGQRLEIECKTGEGDQSAKQREFQEIIEGMGGVYVLARSVDDVLKTLGLEK